MFLSLDYELPGGTPQTYSINASEVKAVTLFLADKEEGATRDHVYIDYRIGGPLRISVEAGRGAALYREIVRMLSAAIREQTTQHLSFTAFPGSR